MTKNDLSYSKSFLVGIQGTYFQTYKKRDVAMQLCQNDFNSITRYGDRKCCNLVSVYYLP